MFLDNNETIYLIDYGIAKKLFIIFKDLLQMMVIIFIEVRN
jgi:hypothetical protein